MRDACLAEGGISWQSRPCSPGSAAQHEIQRSGLRRLAAGPGYRGPSHSIRGNWIRSQWTELDGRSRMFSGQQKAGR